MNERPGRIVPLRALVSDSLLFGLGGVADRLIGFLFLPITSAILGSEGFGVYNLYVTTAAIVFLFSSIGMPNAYFRFGTDATGDWNSRQALDTAFSIVHLLVALWLPILVGFASPVANLAIGVAAPAFIYLLCVRTYCDLLGSLADTRLQAEGRIRQYLFLRLPATVLTRALTLGALIWRRSPLAMAAGEAVGATVGAILAYFLVLRDARFRWDRQLWRAMFRYGVGLSPGMLASWLLVAVNRYLLKALSPSGLTAVGVFSVAERFSSFMLLISQASVLGWRRFAFHNIHVEEGPTLLARGFTLLFAACGLCAVALSLFGPDAVGLLLKSEFIDSIQLIPVLTLGALCGALANSVRIGLLKQYRTNVLSGILVIAAAVAIATAVVLIPRHGALGAAAGALSGQVIALLLNWRYSQSSFHVPFEYGKLGAIGGWMTAGFLGGWIFGGVGTGGAAIAHLVLLCALPVALYRFVPWSDEERTAVANLARQAAGRLGFGSS